MQPARSSPVIAFQIEEHVASKGTATFAAVRGRSHCSQRRRAS
jgi:hypothetical protein